MKGGAEAAQERADLRRPQRRRGRFGAKGAIPPAALSFGEGFAPIAQRPIVCDITTAAATFGGRGCVLLDDGSYRSRCCRILAANTFVDAAVAAMPWLQSVPVGSRPTRPTSPCRCEGEFLSFRGLRNSPRASHTVSALPAYLGRRRNGLVIR